jgi:hypothetical protein
MLRKSATQDGRDLLSLPRQGCLIKCHPNAVCTNDRFCTCKPGYTGDGVLKCSDVDECTEETHNCHVDAICANSLGSFTCTCKPGTSGDGVNSCTPDDRIVHTGSGGRNWPGLEENCDPHATFVVDKLGGSSCVCNPGFIGDGTSCKDFDECYIPPFSTGVERCRQGSTCVNTYGSYICSNCPAGFDSLNGCIDINECNTGLNNCSKDSGCINLSGSYTCQCKSGFKDDSAVGHAGEVCTEINECEMHTDSCSLHATCTNTPGSYTCKCNDGFTGNGRVCTDINECLSYCSPNAYCTNTPGSFSCGACKPGFEGNGQVCVDIDECATGTNDCSDDATCTNTVGSFECQCNAGFIGNGKTCKEKFPTP